MGPVPADCWGKPNKLLGSDLRWTETGISSGPMSQLAQKASRFNRELKSKIDVWGNDAD